MPIEFRCGDCGKMLRAREGQEGMEARCPACGSLTTVPTPEEAAQAARAARARADEEDAPRRSRGAAERTCPECDAPMERGAVLCVECGFDRRLGRRRKTKVKRMERDWTPPPGLVARIAVLVVVVMVVGLICFAMLVGGVHPVVPGLVLLSVTGLGTLAAGWYHTLHLRRDRKGALLLTRRTFFCFAPVGSATVDLGKCEAIQIDAGDVGGGSGIGAGLLGAMFLIFMFGWVGYWIARSNNLTDQGSGRVRFAIRLLSRPKRKPVMTLYSGTNDEFMRDLVDTLKEQGELEVVR